MEANLDFSGSFDGVLTILHSHSFACVRPQDANTTVSEEGDEACAVRLDEDGASAFALLLIILDFPAFLSVLGIECQ